MKLPDNWDFLIGLYHDACFEALAPYGIKAVRITKYNDRYSVCTQDYRLDRINVHVKDGYVTKVTGLG